MTDQNPMPAGWYPDPAQPGAQRQWDGRQWVGPSAPTSSFQPSPGAVPSPATGDFEPVGFSRAPGWYPDPARAGHQREWDGQSWVGPAVPVAGQKKAGPRKWLVPVAACLAIGVFAVIAAALAGPGEEDEADAVRTERSTTTEEPTTTGRPATTERPTTTPPETTTSPEPTTTQAPATTAPPTTAAPTTTTAPPPPPAGPTVSQEQARRSAESYLEFSAFSRTGLIDQLKYEGFSDQDATFGVDAVNPDWNEQAAKSAASYLEFSSFSRQGLIDQLLYEGFTPEQAEYGVSTTGL